MHYSSDASKTDNLLVARPDRRQSSSRGSNWVLIQNHSLSLCIVLISLLLILPHAASASDHGHAAMSPRELYDITVANPGSSGTGPGSSTVLNAAVLSSKPTSTGSQTNSNLNSPRLGSTLPGTGSGSNPPPTGSNSKSNPSSSGTTSNSNPSSSGTTSNSNPNSSGTRSAASSSPAGTKSNPSKPGRGNSTDKSGPTCGFHQKMLQNTTTSAKPTNRTSKDNGILTPDCYNALGHILHMKSGAAMLRMSGPSKQKSCGTCRLEIEAKNSKELFVPLDIVMFGTPQDKSGGLNGLFVSCKQKGGQVILKSGGRLSTTIRIDVSKSTKNHDCPSPAQK